MKTYGNDELQMLLDIVLRDLPANTDYRIVSKGLILKLEFMSEEPYIITFTNLGKLKHSWVIRKVLNQFDDEVVGMDDDITQMDD